MLRSILLKFSESKSFARWVTTNATTRRMSHRFVAGETLDEALQVARVRQETAEWKAEYGVRAGIEGTLSQGVRGFGLRRCRYLGLGKARLQHVATAAAINVYRISDWLGGVPQAATRTSRFMRLVA